MASGAVLARMQLLGLNPDDPASGKALMALGRENPESVVNTYRSPRRAIGEVVRCRG